MSYKEWLFLGRGYFVNSGGLFVKTLGITNSLPEYYGLCSVTKHVEILSKYVFAQGDMYLLKKRG
jgi:hypothetical protein